MRPDLLATLARQHRARLIYLNPTLHNPTTHTMPDGRRAEIAAVVTRMGLRIIEDDPYWHFATHAPRPLAHYAPRHVFHVSTLSKCLLPGLRTAYVVMPEGMAQDEVLAAMRSFVLMSTPLMTALTTQWIHDGTAASLLEGIRTEAWARQELALRTLGAPGVANRAASICGRPCRLTGAQPSSCRRRAAKASTSSLRMPCRRRLPYRQRPTYPHFAGRARSRFELVNALRRLMELAHRRGWREVVV
jgi:hypothetical protein